SLLGAAQAQASAERLLSHARLLLLPGGSRRPRPRREPRARRQFHVGQRLSAPRRHLAALGRGDRTHHGATLRWCAGQRAGPQLRAVPGARCAGEIPAMTRTLRGKVAVVGVGETTYYRHGKSPVSEFKLALQAILAAAKDAGI